MFLAMNFQFLANKRYSNTPENLKERQSFCKATCFALFFKKNRKEFVVFFYILYMFIDEKMLEKYKNIKRKEMG